MLAALLERLPNPNEKMLYIKAAPEMVRMAAGAGLHRLVAFEEPDTAAVNRVYVPWPALSAEELADGHGSVGEETRTDFGSAVRDVREHGTPPPPPSTQPLRKSTGEFVPDPEYEHARALAVLQGERKHPPPTPTHTTEDVVIAQARELETTPPPRSAPPMAPTIEEPCKSDEPSLRERYLEARKILTRGGHGRGRRAPIHPPSNAKRRAFLHDPQMERSVEINPNGTTIGRSDICSVIVANHQISKLHSRITLAGGAFWIEDLQSMNGTWLNGLLVTQRTRLADGDQIVLGITDEHPDGVKVYRFETRER
jgi:hypothetical protein